MLTGGRTEPELVTRTRTSLKVKLTVCLCVSKYMFKNRQISTSIKNVVKIDNIPLWK